MNLTHLDSESNFKLFQLGRAEMWTLGCVSDLWPKQTWSFGIIQRAVCRATGLGIVQKNLTEHLLSKYRTEWNVLSPHISTRIFLPKWLFCKAGAHDIRWLWHRLRSAQPSSPLLASCSHLLQELFSVKPFLFPAAHQLFSGCLVMQIHYRKPSFVTPPRVQSTLVKVLPVLLPLDPKHKHFKHRERGVSWRVQVRKGLLTW